MECDSRTEEEPFWRPWQDPRVFWPERSDARERLSERQQAFFVLTTDQRKVKGERALSLITVWHENVLSTEVMSRDTNNNNNNNHLVMFLSDGRNLELNAATVHGERVF